MFFRDNMYKSETITAEQEEQVLQYADLMVQYLYAQKQVAKSLTEKRREAVDQVHKEMINFMPYIKDIKMSLRESTVYLLIAAAKRNQISALVDVRENGKTIEDKFAAFIKFHEIKVNMVLSKQELDEEQKKEWSKLKIDLQKELDKISINYFIHDEGYFLKKRNFAPAFLCQDAFVESIHDYEGRYLRYKSGTEKHKPSFAVIYTENLLKNIAAFMLNSKAEIIVINHTGEEFSAYINDTKCKLQMIDEYTIEFLCDDGFDIKKRYNGNATRLNSNCLLQCYSMYINNSNSNNIKASFVYADDTMKRIIYESDIIVKSSVRSCQNKEHSVIDVIAKIQVIRDDGEIVWNYLHAGYCEECNEYIVLNADFELLEGTPMCEVYKIVRSVKTSRYAKTYSNSDSESIIHAMGYNVNINDNLSPTTRREILLSIVENGTLTQEEVLAYLDSLIQRGGGDPKYVNAVSKWRSDREYIQKQWYANEVVSVNSITKIIRQKL